MILRNISLKKYNTFHLDYKAECLILVKSEEEAIQVIKDGEQIKKPFLVLGSGSNMLFTSDSIGTIIHPEIGNITVEEVSKEYVIVSSGAGVNWDTFVEWTVNHGYGGLENLSLIPGTVGATPVQNIGAYGVEVKKSIEKVRTVSLTDGEIKEFSNSSCRFSYRDSIFKGELKGKYLITKVYFRLTTKPILNISYGSLKEEVRKLGPLSLKTVRQAVINIRRSKLPDPEIIGNAGSFFKNPVIEKAVADNLKLKYPGIPCFNDSEGYNKIAAGWLIDQCGWKGKSIGNAGVHDKQALVLVNNGNATGKEIFELSEAIKKSVADKFGIELQREVEVI
jgi:UDP-N-acetylmuramate dehydrogenase